MAIRYSGKTIGTFTLVQQRKDEEKPRKYRIQIRQSNCLMCAIQVYKFDNKENPKLCWKHELVIFFTDERHLKNCLKNHEEKSGFFNDIMMGKLENIKLNLFYKECNVLLKYMVKDGLKVTCYYKDK